jgi:hypothetical protein
MPQVAAICRKIRKREKTVTPKPKSGISKNRLSVSLTDPELAELLSLKDRHHVSLAWLGRQAIVEFIAKYREEHVQLPLKLSMRSIHERF